MIISQEAKKKFDFNKIDKDHPLYCNRNTVVIAKFKIETPDTIYKENLFALRSKAYGYAKPDEKEKK